METKPLLYGLIGFFIGGLVVSVAATTFEKNDETMAQSMEHSVSSLTQKTGDDFDAAFIQEMIVHHEGAVQMAQLSEKNAKHEEIKELSRDIVTAQEKEIDQMKRWQAEWGYASADHDSGH